MGVYSRKYGIAKKTKYLKNKNQYRRNMNARLVEVIRPLDYISLRTIVIRLGGLKPVYKPRCVKENGRGHIIIFFFNVF